MKESYCVSCRRKTEINDPTVFKTKNNRILLKDTCPKCGKKKTTFISRINGEGLLSNLGIKTPLANIPLLGPILF